LETGDCLKEAVVEFIASIRDQILAAVPEAVAEIVENASPCAQHSLFIDTASGFAVARLLKDAGFDYCSNATGVDYPDRVELVKETTTQVVDGEEKEIVEEKEVIHPGCLEAVYHLYSIAKREGPLVIRLKTGNRTDDVTLPSLTPVWRSCDFQEREIFDLYGIVFDGHPDLRRLLMWEEFTAHPMRKDYVDPDDYEYEPTPHGEVAERADVHPTGRA
jgi:NADH-quinone oxidoreductase subunit C